MTRAIATVLAFFAPLGLYLVGTYIDEGAALMLTCGVMTAFIVYSFPAWRAG